MTAPDPRLNAYRPDLADIRLEGRVEAERFAKGFRRRLVVPVTRLKREPRSDAPTDTELLFGETVVQFEDNGEGWAWVQAESDDYVGYIPTDSLAQPNQSSTHRVRVPRTFRYPGPDMKLPPVDGLSMGSLVSVASNASTRGTDYAVLDDGTAIVAAHLEPLDVVAPDYVAVAETMIFAPYLWGGRSAFGLDCSGLVQLSMGMAGIDVPRDTDMQERSVGEAIAGHWRDAALKRGDLVFWKGHVAILVDSATIIHANGHSMTVAREPLRDAVDRIARLYAKPTSVRRPSAVR
ncbi:MAG: C40 family peptidase [Rhodobiaceae bacterium]|nr:C40 family peptidase [Rhodobiaceae bacterium]MCC0055132.1 C40 family peptidase [Rhodobiaceae bacterium]